MVIVTAVALIICGILAASTLLLQKRPNAQELIDGIRPYQGIIGVIVLLLGIWTVIECLIYIRGIRYAPFYYLTYLAVGIVEILLGFLLGYGLISKYALEGSTQAQSRGAAMQQKLTGIQVPLGLVGIALGILLIILRLTI